MKTPLRVRLWKSAVPERTAESVNLSQRGIYFATNSVLDKGETVEVLFNMPEEIVGEPMSEWRYTGHVSLRLSHAEEPVVGAGSVVRLHGHEQMGIHLGRLTLEKSQRLQECLLPLLP